MSAMKRKLSEESDILEAVGNVFFAIKRWATRKIRERDIDLTFEQIVVLSILKKEDGLCLGDLSEHIDREKTTVTRMIDGLEKLNLVVRIESREDRRKKLIYLTNPGKQQIAQLEEIRPLVINETLKGLTDKEVKEAVKVLARVLENLSED